MVVRVHWTREALRELTLWIAGFIRDEIELRTARRVHRNLIRVELIGTQGRPAGSEAIQTARGEIVLWEYVQSRLWFAIRRQMLRPTLLQRMLGRTEMEVILLTAIRHRPTPQELESLLP